MEPQITQTQRDFENYISQHMYENHSSFKTFEQTKQTWRTQRAYTEQIEKEIIKKSLIFLSLIDKSCDMKFRRALANFMADYLSVYVSKSPKYADNTNMRARTDRAYTDLNNRFLTWIESARATKKEQKPVKKPKPAPRAPETQPLYTKVILRQGDTIIQEITLRDKTVVRFTYPDFTTYRRNRNTDLMNVLKEHTK